MGRPSQLTPELQQAICAKIREGNFRNAAAQAVGVPIRTFADWITKGKRSQEGLYCDFLQAVIQAEAEAEVAMVKVVVDAAKADASHARFWLERKFPERWGRDAYAVTILKRELRELEKLIRGNGRFPEPLTEENVQ